MAANLPPLGSHGTGVLVRTLRQGDQVRYPRKDDVCVVSVCVSSSERERCLVACKNGQSNGSCTFLVDEKDPLQVILGVTRCLVLLFRQINSRYAL